MRDCRVSTQAALVENPFCGFQTASAAKVGWAAQATHAVSVSITAASNTNPHAAKRPSENCKTRFSDGLCRFAGCVAQTTHAFSATQQIRALPANPKPRAWLRHTPYTRFFRRPLPLRRQVGSSPTSVQSVDVGFATQATRRTCRRVCRPKATHAFPAAQEIRALPANPKPRAWLAPHTLHTVFQTASLLYSGYR